MTNPKTWVLLATYTNDSGDRMEFVLPEVSESEAAQVQAFLDHAYPGGDAVASIVGVESFTAFRESFDGESGRHSWQGRGSASRQAIPRHPHRGHQPATTA